MHRSAKDEYLKEAQDQTRRATFDEADSAVKDWPNLRPKKGVRHG
jgi:hypothetical protein